MIKKHYTSKNYHLIKLKNTHNLTHSENNNLHINQLFNLNQFTKIKYNFSC